MYLAVASRPNAIFATSMLARKIHYPCARHFSIAKRVFGYLKGTKNVWLLISSDSGASLEAYCDADWAGCQKTRRSTTGILVTVNDAPVLWNTKKQTIITLSSWKAAYVALLCCGKLLIWLRGRFCKICHGIVLEDEQNTMHPIFRKMDSSTAKSIVRTSNSFEKNQHISLIFYHVKKLSSPVVWK